MKTEARNHLAGLSRHRIHRQNESIIRIFKDSRAFIINLPFYQAEFDIWKEPNVTAVKGNRINSALYFQVDYKRWKLLREENTLAAFVKEQKMK